MAKMRSPNYPAMSLPSAIGYARKLWNSEKRTPVSNEAAATAMGFKSLSGPARVAIGALRQYGLIDKADRGNIRISERAVHVLIGEGDEKTKALKDAETAPELFQELAKTHADASENAIRSYLLTKKGFADDGARKAAKAFRDTLNVAAKTGGTGYNADAGVGELEDMEGSEAGQNAGGGSGAKPADGVLTLNVPFGAGNISVQVRTTGSAISAAHLARVRKYLELAEEDLRDSAILKSGQYPTRDE